MDKQKIIEKTSPDRDTLQDAPDKHLKWTIVNNESFQYRHKRPLPRKAAREAIKYINVLTRQYPFQLRYAMAIPLWERFSQEWCESGDLKKSLRGI